MAKAVFKEADEPVPLIRETETTDVGASQTSSKPVVAPVFQKAKAAARPKKAAAQTKIEGDDGDVQMLRQSPVRKPRAASKKARTYNLSDSESNGDDMLFDVGKMVKGIDNASADQNASSRPLFSSGSMPRPGSSSGLAKKTAPAAKQIIDPDDDDTDYSKLAPPPASKRAAPITARSKVILGIETDEDDDIIPARALSPPPKASKKFKAPKTAAAPPTKSQARDTDEDDDDIFPARVPSTPPKAAKASKSAKQTTAKPVKAKASTTATVKQTTQTKLAELPKVMSPAAKAYAAKRARNATKNDTNAFDAIEKVADEIMDEGSVIADEDDDDEGDESLVVRRPTRKAAVQAAVKSKKSYKLDSDEDEDEDEIDDNEDEEEQESEGFDDDDD